MPDEIDETRGLWGETTQDYLLSTGLAPSVRGRGTRATINRPLVTWVGRREWSVVIAKEPLATAELAA